MNRLATSNAIGAASVAGGTAPVQGAGAGSTPSAALHTSPTFRPKDLDIRPVSSVAARRVCQHNHYLRSYPGGAILNFGIFADSSLLGVAVLGVGPANAHRLFSGAERQQVLCLARLWLDDRLGRNCESRTLAIILRHLRRDQETIKALVAYSDPAAGHTGCIYRAAGFLYLGRSDGTPVYRLPDGSVRHSRSLSQTFGTHSRKHFQAHGVPLQVIPQPAKLTYVALVDPAWRSRLTRPVLPYPRQGEASEDY